MMNKFFFSQFLLIIDIIGHEWSSILSILGILSKIYILFIRDFLSISGNIKIQYTVAVQYYYNTKQI